MVSPSRLGERTGLRNPFASSPELARAIMDEVSNVCFIDGIRQEAQLGIGTMYLKTAFEPDMTKWQRIRQTLLATVGIKSDRIAKDGDTGTIRCTVKDCPVALPVLVKVTRDSELEPAVDNQSVAIILGGCIIRRGVING